MPLTDTMTFEQAFLVLFAGYRADSKRTDAKQDLARAEPDARAFMERLAQIEAEKKGKK